jgi:putative oxidoreductase
MRNGILRYQSLNTDLAALLLRLTLGGLFMYYGWMKIDMYHQILPMFKDYIGIGSKLSLNLVIFAEFFCGFFVLIGFFTRLTIIPIFITMIVVFFIVFPHAKFEIKNLPFVYLLLTIVVFVLGSGRFSVDGIIQRRRSES